MKRLILIGMTVLTVIANADTEWSNWTPTNSIVVCGDFSLSFSVNQELGTAKAFQRHEGYYGTATIPNTITLTFSRYRWTGINNGSLEREYKNLQLRVTGIDCQAFQYCTGLTNIILPGSITQIDSGAFYGCTGLTSVTLPESITLIGSGAFYGCTGLTSVTLPESTTSIGNQAFYCCSGLTSATILGGVTNIGYQAFAGCNGLTSVTMSEGMSNIGISMFNGCNRLTSVTIPESVTSIGASAFYGCSQLGSADIGSYVSSIGANCFCSCMNLTNVIFHGNAPTTVGGLVFSETSLDLNIIVPNGSIGWCGDGSNAQLPVRWPYNTETGRYIRHPGDEPILSDGSEKKKQGVVTLTVTNVVVNYILNSIQPDIAVPASSDTGFVNIIAEVNGSASGAVAVPDSWTANYPKFTEKFGSNFTKALTSETKKRDANGKPMFVWQDYVAGTDPTDTNDVFTASITTDTNGKLIISYTPELSDDEKAKRIYKTLGKAKLTDADWTEIPAGHEAEYNFFKVTVEMK